MNVYVVHPYNILIRKVIIACVLVECQKKSRLVASCRLTDKGSRVSVRSNARLILKLTVDKKLGNVICDVGLDSDIIPKVLIKRYTCKVKGVLVNVFINKLEYLLSV